MKRFILAAFVITIAIYFFSKTEINQASPISYQSAKMNLAKTKTQATSAAEKNQSTPREESQPPSSPEKKAAQLYQQNSNPQKTPGGIALKFVLEDGLAVVQGDLIVGVLTDQNAAIDEDSRVFLPNVKLWPTSVIPYFIDPNVQNPDRILQAFALFNETPIQFVAYNNQKDALVFSEGTENCKSYVGQVGGLQQVLLTNNCSAIDIAHELMHALGFVHEQNRSDRDEYIQVNFDNIEPKNKENFEKLPAEFMAVSGLATFDFESLMIYPTWMFGRSGHATMQSKSGQQIVPTEGLSRTDVQRVKLAYDGR